MRIIGHGVDIVETARIRAMLDEHGERFLERCFTPGERGYCDEAGQGRRVERYAARFAAKEAALKAIGTGWRSGIAWTDVEVVRDQSGQPLLSVTGEAARRGDELNVDGWIVSLSHAAEYAVASVIATNQV